MTSRRDLTPELEHRLKDLERRENDARIVLNEIAEERELVAKLLQLEKRHSGKEIVPPKKRELRAIAGEMLLKGAPTRAAIVHAAEKEGHEMPARGVNAILMGYERLKFVERNGEKFELTIKGRNTLGAEAEGAD